MTTLGTRIAMKRKALGMTQEELAAKLGISSQAVSKWENDVSSPDISLLVTLANLLNTTVDELLTGKDNQVRVLPEAQRKNPNDLVMRIKILSSEGDKVQVNLPLPLIRALSGPGMDIAAHYAGTDALKGIDLEQILTLAENGIIGKLVEVQSADGDTVEIVVE